MFPSNHVHSYICERDAVELWIDRDEIDGTRFVHLDVTQVTVGFAADHIRQS